MFVELTQITGEAGHKAHCQVRVNTEAVAYMREAGDHTVLVFGGGLPAITVSEALAEVELLMTGALQLEAAVAHATNTCLETIAESGVVSRFMLNAECLKATGLTAEQLAEAANAAM